MQHRALVEQAAAAVRRCRRLVVTSGAGMGVDSGLPDFRGPEGLWKAYPALREVNLDFYEMADPRWFRSNPRLAWGFYGHRLHLYRNTVPNDGFAVLKRWGEGRFGGEYFAWTSNVDGQFQAAGFPEDRVLECHGSIHHMQGVDGAGPVVSADGVGRLEIDPKTLLVDVDATPLPTMPDGSPARPNILLFSDASWCDSRHEGQARRYDAFLQSGGPTVVVEVGAGTAVPSVRRQSQWLRSLGGGNVLVRINLREAYDGDVNLACTGVEALKAIDELL
ncbi:NAD-dependent protein deacylase [Diplonema papillatum]|nr:NAD-dependent protein deacylase [Diplonema papillatum]